MKRILTSCAGLFVLGAFPGCAPSPSHEERPREAMKMGEEDPPSSVRVNFDDVVALIKKTFREEEGIFIQKVELVQEKATREEDAWVWKVELSTRHANHWGPASLEVDAERGGIVSESNHR